jgi:polysaccharide export outer membrane protein
MCVKRLTGSIVRLAIFGVFTPGLVLPAQTRPANSTHRTPSAVDTTSDIPAEYILGPSDQITVWVRDAEEITDKPVEIDTSGYVTLPFAGRVRAAGLTVQQLQAELSELLKPYFRRPQVAVRIAEYRSQPVSVIGAVKAPGVLQLRGQKTLVEILSMAGGLREDAGPAIKISRRLQWGPIPLPTAATDPTGEFSVAEVNLGAVMEGRNPEENILIRPNDIVSIPRAKLVYVLGEVVKAGGFVLDERESISVLEALSLAGGLNRTASAQGAKILRPQSGNPQRQEIAVNLKHVLSGKGIDVALQPEDILFIPESASKKATARTIETLIQTISGIVIFRGF